MKKLLKYISFVLIGVISLTSCSKEPTKHNLKFEIRFTEEPNNGNSNAIDVSCSPNYSDDKPVIAKSIIKPGYVWTYQYNELVDGDEVLFVVNSQLSYRFEMKVYIDGTVVSTRNIVTSDNTYYATVTESQTGINNSQNENYPIIDFYYYE